MMLFHHKKNCNLKDLHHKTFIDFFTFQIALTRSIFELEKCSFFFKQVRIWLVMLSVRYPGKNACSAGKTSALLRGDASRANRCYVVAHCALSPPIFFSPIFSPFHGISKTKKKFQIFFCPTPPPIFFSFLVFWPEECTKKCRCKKNWSKKS